jgi:hypothetical protein
LVEDQKFKIQEKIPKIKKTLLNAFLVFGSKKDKLVSSRESHGFREYGSLCNVVEEPIADKALAEPKKF